MKTTPAIPFVICLLFLLNTMLFAQDQLSYSAFYVNKQVGTKAVYYAMNTINKSESGKRKMLAHIGSEMLSSRLGNDRGTIADFINDTSNVVVNKAMIAMYKSYMERTPDMGIFAINFNELDWSDFGAVMKAWNVSQGNETPDSAMLASNAIVRVDNPQPTETGNAAVSFPLPQHKETSEPQPADMSRPGIMWRKKL